MSNGIKETFMKACRGSNDDLLNFLNQFSSAIKKRARDLNYEEAETDLIIFLIEFIGKQDPLKVDMYTEPQIVTYIIRSLDNKKVDILRHLKTLPPELKNDIIWETVGLTYEDDFTENCFLEGLFSILTKRQKQVIIMKYYFDYTDVMIANKLKITRQAVNGLKRAALTKLKDDWVSSSDF